MYTTREDKILLALALLVIMAGAVFAVWLGVDGQVLAGVLVGAMAGTLAGLVYTTLR